MEQKETNIKVPLICKIAYGMEQHEFSGWVDSDFV